MQRIIEDEASPSVDYSHFVSLPLAIHPALVNKLVNFQNSILADSNEDLGIEKSIFINPKTFHLTVFMLKLWNKDGVNAATEVLKSISTKVMDTLDNRLVFVKLKGLDCMRGSLAKAYVVYAPVEVLGGEDCLLHACQIITDAFLEAGLVLEKDAKQKLKQGTKSPSHLMHGAYSSSLDLRNGAVIISVRLIFHKDSSKMKADISIAVPIPFPEKKGSTRFGAALFNLFSRPSEPSGREADGATRGAGTEARSRGRGVLSVTTGRGAGSITRGRGGLSVTTGRGDGSGTRGAGSSTRARGAGGGTSGRGAGSVTRGRGVLSVTTGRGDGSGTRGAGSSTRARGSGGAHIW